MHASRTLMREYLKSLVGGGGVKVAALIVGFALQLLCVRIMGEEAYGHYIYAMTWLSGLLIVVVSAVDSSALRFIPQYDRPELATLKSGYLAWATKRMNRNLVLVIGGGVLMGMALAQMNANFSLGVFLVLMVSIYSSSRGMLFASSLQAMKHPVIAHFPRSVLLPVVAMAGLVVFYGLGLRIGAFEMACIYVVASYLAYFLVARMHGYANSDAIKEVGSFSESEQWRRFSNQMFLVGLLNLLLSRFDLLLLGAYVPAEEVGIYNVCARLAEICALALVVSNIWVGPMISRHFHRQEHAQLQHLLTYSGRLITAMTAIAVLGVVLFGPMVLGWYGPNFQDGYEALIILSVGQLLNALFGPVGFMLTMTGHGDVALRIYGIAVLVMTSASLLLIPSYGIDGAALASAFGVVTWNLLMCIYVVRRLKLDPTALGLLRGRL